MVAKTAAAKAVQVVELPFDEPTATGGNGKVSAAASAVVNDKPKQPEKPPSPYPEGTELFRFNPSGGGDPIELPLKFTAPNKRFLFEQYQRNFLAQTWEWMKLAGVPMAVQNQIIDLPDEEYGKCFEEWFAAVTGGTKPGE